MRHPRAVAKARAKKAAAPAKLPLAALLAIALALLLIYGQTAGHAFLNYDDDAYITANAHVREGLTGSGIVWAFTAIDYFYWQPLTWLSHMLDCTWFGLAPGPHHLTNALLHGVNAFLLFSIVRMLLGSAPAAAAAAALWALHPLRVESVAWAAERKDVLCALLWLLAVRSYLAARRLSWRASVFFVLALMAKPMAATLPLLFLGFDRWPLRRVEAWSALLREKAALLAVAAASALLTWQGQGVAEATRALGDVPLASRVAHAVTDPVLYLWRTVAPFGLAIVYPYDREVPGLFIASSALVLAGLTAAAWRARARFPAVWTGWLWFAITLVPVSGLIQAGPQAGADRFTYIPAMGLMLALAALVPSRGLLPGSVAAAALLTFASFRQTAVWRDTEAVFRHALAVTGPNWMAERNLAGALMAAGRRDEAIARYQASLRIYPDQFETRYQLGIALAGSGDWAAALAHFRESARLRPVYPSAQYAIGLALQKLNRWDETVPELERALTLPLAPEFAAQARNILGVAYARRGDRVRAEQEFRNALALRPDLPDARQNLERLRAMPPR
jgi:tetratricopeptide (TPR) repeat protein